jgi:hypothetical protein
VQTPESRENVNCSFSARMKRFSSDGFADFSHKSKLETFGERKITSTGQFQSRSLRKSLLNVRFLANSNNDRASGCQNLPCWLPASGASDWPRPIPTTSSARGSGSRFPPKVDRARGANKREKSPPKRKVDSCDNDPRLIFTFHTSHPL